METWLKRIWHSVRFPFITVGIVYLTANLLLPLFNFPEQYCTATRKILNLVLIAAITWILLKAIDIFGSTITQISRAAYTKISLLKRIINFIVIIFAIAIALLTFDSVRQLGVSILASAGFASVILGFAAQKTLSSFFAGLQIALTQPIKIDDVVIIENEFGNIEEITLSYVVVRLWDQRRMIVPINYFLDKPFQNWTRASTELLGTVFLYVDYTVPILSLREELTRLLHESKYWDGKTSALEVTDCKEKTLELRVLLSARDSGDRWKLACEVREGLITYIQNHYPQALPKIRIISES